MQPIIYILKTGKMSSVQKTLDGASKVSVLIYHSDDPAVATSLETLNSLSSKDQIKRVLVMKVGEESKEESLISDGKTNLIDLENAIASIELVKAVDLISVCSSYLGTEGQRKLHKEAGMTFQSLSVLAPRGCDVRDHRLYFPKYRHFGDPSPFLQGVASSRLIILPEDKQNDATFGKGLIGVQDESFGSHIAVEFISIAGLWTTISGSVLEDISQTSSGITSPQIQIARSFVRTATSPLAAYLEDYSQEVELQAPSAFTAAPDPYYLAEQAAEAIHMSDFRLRPESLYEPSRLDLKSSSLLRRMIKRLLLDFRSLKKTVLTGYASGVNSAVDEFAQGLIGENSWLNCLPPASAEKSSVTQEEIDNAIDELQRSATTREEFRWNGKSAWPEVLSQTLGVVDGGDESSQIRKDAGNDKWLILDRSVLTAKHSENISDVVDSLQDSGTNQLNEKRLTLLQRISNRFGHQTRISKERCEELLNRLINLKPEEQDNSDEGVSKIVSTSFKLATFLIILTILVLPEWSHNVLDFHENYRSIVKARWFWILSFLPAFSIALITAPSTSKSRQNHMLGFTSIYVLLGIFVWFVPTSGLHVVTVPLIVAALLIATSQFPRIKQWLQQLKIERLSSEAEVNISPEESLDDIVEQVSESENQDGSSSGESSHAQENRWSDRGKQIFGIVTPPYLMLTLVLGLNDSNNLRKGVFENPSPEFFWSSFLFCLVLFLVSFVIIDITRQREETKIALWKGEYQWLVEETKLEFRNYKIIETFEIQWLGTASVIARIFAFPFGKMPNQTEIEEASESKRVPLMKFQSTELELTESGEKEFKDKARWEINSAGWLSKSYSVMAREYARKSQSVTSESGYENIVTPEECPYPVSLEEAKSGLAKGRRWPFCYEVYDGKYDNFLRESIENKLSEIMFKTFIENPESYTVKRSDEGLNLIIKENLAEAFTKILPSIQSNWVPGVFGPPEEINYTVPDNFRSTIWWPKAIDLPASSRESESLVHTSEEYSHAEGVIVQAVSIDLSEVLVLNEFHHKLFGEVEIEFVFDPNHEPGTDPYIPVEFKRDIHGNRVQINDPFNVDSDNDDDLDDGEW